MDDALAKRGRSMEEVFFMQRNAQSISQFRKLEQMSRDRQVLVELFGISNVRVLD